MTTLHWNYEAGTWTEDGPGVELDGCEVIVRGPERWDADLYATAYYTGGDWVELDAGDRRSGYIRVSDLHRVLPMREEDRRG